MRKVNRNKKQEYKARGSWIINRNNPKRRRQINREREKLAQYRVSRELTQGCYGRSERCLHLLALRRPF
jgi:hypothetical protein